MGVLPIRLFPRYFLLYMLMLEVIVTSFLFKFYSFVNIDYIGLNRCFLVCLGYFQFVFLTH